VAAVTPVVVMAVVKTYNKLLKYTPATKNVASFVFVIGFEIWREWARGEHIGFPIGPKDKQGWAIYGRAWFRMFIWFIGAAITMLGLSAWQNI